LSLGSPHLGAPLAQSLLYGGLQNWAITIAEAFDDSFNYYLQNDPDFWDIHFSIRHLAVWLFDILAFIDYWVISQVFGPASLGPLLPQMVPGSSFLATLNAPSNIAAEQAITQSRVGFSTELSPNYQPFSLWAHPSDAATMETIRILIASFAVQMFDHYSEHEDYFLRANRYQWLWLYQNLATVPQVWHGMNGTLEFWNYATGEYGISRSDGAVPWNRSVYPGGTNVTFPMPQFVEIRHKSQQSSTTLRAQVIARLRAMGVGDRVHPPVPPPNPPAFLVQFTGALSVPPGSTCNYFGGAGGGEEPYSFVWELDGVQIGIGASAAVTYPSEGTRTLALRVTDGTGAVETYSREVQVFAGAAPCADL
jgi:hypothetical protein